MTTVILKGLSRHGKNRVREQGSLWTVLQVVEQVAFTNEAGPWLLLESMDKFAYRWVHQTRDKDFAIQCSVMN